MGIETVRDIADQGWEAADATVHARESNRPSDDIGPRIGSFNLNNVKWKDDETLTVEAGTATVASEDQNVLMPVFTGDDPVCCVHLCHVPWISICCRLDRAFTNTEKHLKAEHIRWNGPPWFEGCQSGEDLKRIVKTRKLNVDEVLLELEMHCRRKLEEVETVVRGHVQGTTPEVSSSAASAIGNSPEPDIAIEEEQPQTGKLRQTDLDSEFAYSRSGDGYNVAGFGEAEYVPTIRCKGLHQIAMLLAPPGVPVPMARLDGTEDDLRILADERSKQPIADNDEMKKLWSELNCVKAELETAESEENTLIAEECRTRIDQIMTVLKTYTGIGGKPRDVNSITNRRRAKINGTLKTGYKRIRDASLGKIADHLQVAIKSEGECYTYVPTMQPLPIWQMEICKT
ncbi:MAG: hypothetical protein IID45_08895 [Planctomycetes bacterium]|nr:hypothetical protein [Planctomycetota bacterium]